MSGNRSTDVQYEVYAVRYAHREARRPEHFIGGDPHDAPMPMDYFVWAVIGPDKAWVVDTGFDRMDADKRKRQYLRSAAEGLARIGVDAAKVEDVIVTHLHYDHIGGFGQFPAARFHLQDREMAYATGRHMGSPSISHAFEAAHIAEMVHNVFGGRVVFHDGDVDLAQGLSLHLVGGHTMGLQVVRVHTRIGWIVLASDAAHYYENMEAGRPFPIVYNVGDYLDAFRTARRLADSPDFIVPGHDPLVLERYPAAAKGLEGIAVRLDVAPKRG